MARREWTSADFSGCTLASGDQQVIVIVSLLVTSGSNEFDIQSLEQQVCGIYNIHTRVFPSLEIYTIILLIHTFVITAHSNSCSGWW